MTPRERAFSAAAAIAGSIWFAFALQALAQEAPQIQCPTPEPCQVLVLTETEVKILTQENGILATAAQARNLDLGQYVSYFRQKLAVAPAGRPQPPAAPQAPAGGEKKPEEARK